MLKPAKWLSIPNQEGSLLEASHQDESEELFVYACWL